jgi:hypothetical protein
MRDNETMNSVRTKKFNQGQAEKPTQYLFDNIFKIFIDIETYLICNRPTITLIKTFTYRLRNKTEKTKR